MINTLAYLKSKATQLHTKLKAHEVPVAKKYKQHLFAYVLGFKNWDELQYKYQQAPGPHTNYQLDAERLSLAKGIPLEKSIEVLEEIRWPNEYIPVFNLLPISEEGCISIPSVFVHSNVFSNARSRRKGCLRQRVAWSSCNSGEYKDFILYSGEQLNIYDEGIFYALIHNHPADTPVGRDFYIYKSEIALLTNKRLSCSGLDQSLKRMMDCRLEILPYNFFGPLIANYKKVSSKSGVKYRISLNPELTKLYRDPLYGRFMDFGNLFHYKPRNNSTSNPINFKLSEKSKKQLSLHDFIKHSQKLGELWPTHDSDIAAIWAIITQDACNGSVQFKFIQDLQFNEDNDQFTFSMPNWFHIAYRHFEDTYGEEAGYVIFMKAMDRFTEPLFSKN